MGTRRAGTLRAMLKASLHRCCLGPGPVHAILWSVKDAEVADHQEECVSQSSPAWLLVFLLEKTQRTLGSSLERLLIVTSYLGHLLQSPDWPGYTSSLAAAVAVPKSMFLKRGPETMSWY